MKKKGKLNRQYPKLAKEFHPVLNGEIRPKDVDINTKIRHWWKCPKKYCQASYQATVRQRVSEEVICPTCEKRAQERALNKIKKDPLFVEWEETKKNINTIDKYIVEFLNEDFSHTRKMSGGRKVKRALMNIENDLKEFRNKTMELKKAKYN